ncbi:MAG: alkaline phosphatase family protein [Ferruginibacter sp.]
MKKGFSFENTLIPYTPAVTAAGHTTLYSGTVPAVHGIVGNDWVERRTGDTLYCSQDESVQTVGSFSAAGRMSPRNMFTSTIGDELRLATNFKSRVYGIALKDRGGIFPAGHSANAAYWFDDSTGNWISSSYYMNALPQWVQNFNAEKRPDDILSKPWNRLYDSASYVQSVADERPYERSTPLQVSKGFPHRFTTNGGRNYQALRIIPFGNTFTLDFAKQMIEKEKLGSSGQTDMLCISLSSTDFLAHRFGPQASETEDCYLRLDKDLELFFKNLDKTLGRDNYLLFVSADHGAPQTPDYLVANKLPAGSIRGKILANELNAELFKKFKVRNLVRKYYEYQLYLNDRSIDSAGLDSRKVYDYAVNLLLLRPEILQAFDYRNFHQTILQEDLKKRLANGYFYSRSGDIQMIPKPHYTDASTLGTDHGVGYTYDTHIPLILYGWGIKPGKTNRQTYMTDLAPTISAMLHIQMPNGSVGQVLEEVMK